MFKRNFAIIENKFFGKTIDSFPIRKSKFYEEMPFNSNEYYEFNNLPRILFFTSEEEEKGRQELEKMGIDPDDWFVCFHARDSKYLDGMGHRADLSYHDFRDSNIENYLTAMEYITKKGGYAIRMGYIVDKTLNTKRKPKIIDYASYYRTEFGDIYLHAKCKFSLGDTAGLWIVPTLFHVPVAGVNWTAPLEHTPFRKGDLFIPKKVWSIEKERFLTLREILESDVCHFQRADRFAEARLRSVENTPEEILDLTREMNERLDGTWKTTKEDEELQEKYWSFIKPHHWCYGSPARIGTIFLRKNKELLK